MGIQQRTLVGLRGVGVLALVYLLALAVWTVAGEPIIELGELLATTDGSAPTSMRFDEALTALCALAACGCAGWLALVSSAVVLEALVAKPARRRHTAWCPATVRRLILGACGVALTAGLTTTPAAADSAGSAGAPATVGRALVTGLMIPDRTVDRSRAAMAPDRPAVVQVRPGDSLWSLAAEALGPAATDTEIAVAWHSIHLANVGRIGTDPDLIFPGTVLQLPASVTAERTSTTTHRRENR